MREGPAGLTLGPDSVGYRLPDGAGVGAKRPTITDAAVCVGRAQIGSTLISDDHADLLGRALRVADEMLADAVDRMKLGRDDVPLIVVGGGSVLLPDQVPGVSKILRPEHYDVANAIGAAIARVSGRWDEVVSLAPGRGGHGLGLRPATAARCRPAPTRTRSRSSTSTRSPPRLPHRASGSDHRKGSRPAGPVVNPISPRLGVRTKGATMRKNLATVGVALALASVLAACSGTPPKAAAPADSTFTYANNLEVMTSWDPATSYSNEVIALSNVYEQLTRYDSATGTVGLLADSWTTSENGLTWTFSTPTSPSAPATRWTRTPPRQPSTGR